MYKIDSHQHFWDLQQLSYPWMSPDQPVLYRNYTPPDLAPALAETGVAGIVVVQATHDVRETEWLLGLAHQADFIRGVVGWVNLTAPDLGDQMGRLRALGPLVGIRHQVHDEQDNEWIVREAVLRGLRTLAAQDMPYDLLVRPPHLPVLPRLLDAVPGMTWIVDHLAKPDIARSEIQPWRDDMARVAQYPNVVCKVSGMITEARAAWTVNDIHPYFDAVLELFGPERLMFGSDWPVCLLAGSYQQVHDLVVELVRDLSPDEQAAIWAGTARRVYRL